MLKILGVLSAGVLIGLLANAQTAPNHALPLAAQTAGGVPSLRYTVGPPTVFAPHTDFATLGYWWGPSDGQFGAIPAGRGNYTFYGTAGTLSNCAGSGTGSGVYTFTGSLAQFAGSKCTRVFGPGDAPIGWIFDADYAGGGQIVPFALNGQAGWLMPFHGEVQWQNSMTSDHTCNGVHCFYSSLGIAYSTDGGKTFTVAGQILQPSEPMSVFTGGGKNMNVGYGSLIVADANGNHLENPPPDPSSAYFYLFFIDLLPGSPGVCNAQICTGVARANYANVVTAALSGDPDQVAKAFMKYNGATPNAWTQPATSDTPDESGTAGTYAPLWTDEPAGGSVEVIYDSAFNVYLAVYTGGEDFAGFEVRASNDLIHWSSPLAPAYTETGRALYYPTFLGETGDPTIGYTAPLIYFSSFPTGDYPNYDRAVLESVALTLWDGSVSPSPVFRPGNARGER